MDAKINILKAARSVPGIKMNNEAVIVKSGMRWIGAMWAALAIILFVGGGWFFKTQIADSEKASLETLISIARLKISAIEDWRLNKIADARVLTGSLYLIQKIQMWMASPTAEDTDNLINRFRLTQESYGYYNILLVDTAGNTLINARAPGTRESLSREALSAMESSVRDHKPIMTDLYIDSVTGKPRLDVVAPFYVHIAGKDKFIAAAILTRDPEEFLYPIIKMWPILSKSADTVLFRREGNSVLVLNDVRFYPGAALKMKLSLAQTKIPAVQAVLGRRGIFSGVDYHGNKVVSFLAAVPDSPWLMVSKINADEIFAGIFLKLSIFYGMMATLIAAAFISTLAMRQRVVFFKKLYEKDETIRSYASRLEEINKELKAFSYSVSHDLRAPLRGMEGFSKILLKEYADKLDDTGKDCLMRVSAAAKNMGLLIDALLNLSRISRLKMEIAKVDLSRLAEHIATELKNETPGREVKFLIQPNLVARADARLLEVALQNILGNAWKFTSKNLSAKIEFGAVQSEGRNVYFVRDNGAGFDQRYYDKLFNPFQRLHSEKDYPGTGIGLATVRRVIERHGGHVRAESEVGKGATFYFTLNEKKETV